MEMALPCPLRIRVPASPKWMLAAVSRLIRQLLPGRLIAHARVARGKSARISAGSDDELDEKEQDHQDGFVVFEVENALFKIHMSLLRLEIWSPADSEEPEHRFSEKALHEPVVLSDTAENFRFFLWDLQAFPHELSRLEDGESDVIHVLDRLLNIAETACKHRLTPLESRALRSLRHFVLSPYFHSVSPAQHCRTLRIATRSTCPAAPPLLRALSRRLTHRILRRCSGVDPKLASSVAQDADARLTHLRGAVSYRRLITLERRIGRSRTGATTIQPVFPRDMDLETRVRLLAAHASFLALGKRIRAAPPALPLPSPGHAHAECERAWAQIWERAVRLASESQSEADAEFVVAPELGLPESADVLGCLRAMTPHLKRMVADDTETEPGMAIECGLAALEAVAALRDEIVDGLGSHFEFPDSASTVTGLRT